jgi:hypothetical protein
MQPEVHCHAYNSPRLFPVLSHTDPFHAVPYCFFNVRFNIILSSRLTVSSKNLVCISVSLHATCPAQLILLGVITRMISGASYKP